MEILQGIWARLSRSKGQFPTVFDLLGSAERPPVDWMPVEQMVEEVFSGPLTDHHNAVGIPLSNALIEKIGEENAVAVILSPKDFIFWTGCQPRASEAQRHWTMGAEEAGSALVMARWGKIPVVVHEGVLSDYAYVLNNELRTVTVKHR